jgi:hypothetical protein
MPAKAGIQKYGIIQSRSERDWIPASAGMTLLSPDGDTVSWGRREGGGNRSKGSFAQAAFLVLPAAAARTRIVAACFGAYPGFLGLSQGDLLLEGLPSP